MTTTPDQQATILNQLSTTPAELKPLKHIGRPRKWQSPEEIIQLADDYFSVCLAADPPIPLTITGLCRAIGTTRDTLIKMSNGDYSDSAVNIPNGVDFTPFIDAIKRIRMRCEEYAEQSIFTARNPAGGIFALKNYGWKDIQTHETTGLIQHSADPATLKILSEVLSRLSGRPQDDQVIDISPVQEQLSTGLSTVQDESYQPVLVGGRLVEDGGTGK